MTDAPFEDEVLRSIVWWFPRLGIAACIAILGLAAGLLALALKPRVPPYVVALDHGRIVGYAHAFAGSEELAPMVIEDRLKEVIYNARVVTANRELEEHNIHTVYAMARAQASRALDAYYQASPDNDPVKLGLKGDWRDVRIVRCLREPEPDTYRVEWTETLHPQTGDAVTSNWEATMQVVIAAPDTSNDLNPIGLYVTSLDMEEAETK
jgi:type IV secretory pathway TrbF-like protein